MSQDDFWFQALMHMINTINDVKQIHNHIL